MIVSLIPHTDFSPVPRVEIRLDDAVDYDGGDAGAPGSEELDGGDPSSSGGTLDGGSPSTVIIDVPEGTETVTVWRYSQGRSIKARGIVDRVFTGEAGYLDLEAGHDVTSAYELECFTDGQSVGRIAIGSLTLPWEADPDGVLIQQPLNPNLAVVAKNLSGSWPTITREAPGELVYTEGAEFPILISSGPRRGVTGVDIDFGVATREDAERVWATLGTPEQRQLPVWLIRSHHGFLPRVFFCHVRALTEVDINLRHRGEWTRFQATVDEIAPPAPGLVISPLSYPDLDVTFASYDDMDAAYPSYNARDTAWDLAGAAG